MKSSLLSVITLAGSTATYYVFFPHQGGNSTTTPVEVGDRSTVLVIPVQPDYPPFDPTKTYNWTRTGSKAIIDVAASPIPPSYLSQPCFTTGTLIRTATGPRPVESLQAGDLVMTRDHGLRPVAWTGGRHLSARHLDIAPNLRPVLIRRGALGAGLPVRDLLVSPQHRVLIRSKIAERLTGEAEALVAARHLCGMPGIAVINPANGVGYYHILFDRHEIVESNGCWTESLFTGTQALASISPAALREIRAIFPELFQPHPSPRSGARRFLDGRDAKELLRRHIKNSKPLIV
ncbi:Hint domain-containing protein [Paracoccus aurantiacus]|uniref:Hint domain-containing protein n=2 Tax=Paracoccus aurantiacus TaxID=2599412 RepID=A0A5C6SA70_9RHOB|nr:Hint domain-containing protein [Paracoccus aurantiacus]